MMRILLLEDEKNIRESVKINLELDGFEVVATDQGLEALKMIEGQHFDLAIIDIMLPDISGLDVCERIRVSNSKLPIVIISAKDTSQDRIQGLKRGADDYLNKPFDIEELLLRIQKIIARSSIESKANIDLIKLGEFEVNLNSYVATRGEQSFGLTQKEIQIIKLMYDRKNEVVSRNEILKTVWGYEVYPSTRTVDNFIHILRKHFEEDISKPKLFVSVRGVGYKLQID